MRNSISILILGAFITLLTTFSQEIHAECVSENDLKASRFLEHQITITPGRISVNELVRTLKNQKIPISFIEGGDGRSELNMQSSSVTARDTLNAICLAVPSYEASIVNEHIVLYPKNTKLSAPLPEVNINNLPRLEAATQLVAILKRTDDSFADLVSPFVFGNPNSDVYTDPVTITGPTSILKAFVALLGRDEALTFEIVRTKTNVRVMGFTKLPL